MNPRTFVLVIQTDPEHPEHGEFIRDTLAVVRSGLMAPHSTTDKDVEAWAFYGPFEPDELDTAVIGAIADYCEGHDTGPSSDNEPDIIRGRQIRTVARATALGTAARQPVEAGKP